MVMEYGLGAWNMNFVLFYVTRRNIIITIIFQFWKSVWFFVYIIVYCVGAGIATLMSFSDDLGSYFLRRRMERA